MSAPLLGIAGFAGAGKTTTICALLEAARAEGLTVGVIKHLHHPVKESGDTERFAPLAAWVRGVVDEYAFEQALAEAPLADLILVEGFKSEAFPKLWIDPTEPPPAPIRPFVVPAERADWPTVRAWLDRQWAKRPTRGALLVGGESRRMGLPKAYLSINQQLITTKLVLELRQIGEVSVIGQLEPLHDPFLQLHGAPDVPGLRGPLAGILAAPRLDPEAAWLVLGCDFPLMTHDALVWLLSHRAPGRWVCCPRLDGHLLPVAACYEPPGLVWLAGCADKSAGIVRLLEHLRQCHVMDVPPEHVRAFQSANTPEEWAALTGEPPTRWKPDGN